MDLTEKTLLNLLIDVDSKSNNQSFYSYKKEDVGYLNPVQMSYLYTSSALLVTIMGFLKEQLWLKNREDKKLGEETTYENFITPYFFKELMPVYFLKEFLIKSGSKNMMKVSHDSQVIEHKVLTLIGLRSNRDQKEFTVESLNEMNVHFINEEQEQEGKDPVLGHQGLELYRTFDNLDKIFKIDYQLDHNMKIDHTVTERLYAGSGVGVQSGYSTILLALNNIETKFGGKVIDLGSGYGRVGLVCSLLRPDIEFIGYEYVPHRVDVGNMAVESLELSESLTFKTQDLSLESFKVPEADVYYLYDPFTKDTYEYVLKQIIEFSKVKKVTVVTKGNARGWLVNISKDNNWLEPEYIDERNLCIFRSC